jgi:hypothetical protein
MMLPKQVESDPDYRKLLQTLESAEVLLWRESTNRIPMVEMNDRLRAVLQMAGEDKHLQRGIEGIERSLGIEARGLTMVDKKTETARVQRISRLLLLSNDGAERLYRKVESLLRVHGQRVMAIKINSSSAELGELLFGPGKAVKVLLLDRKESVAEALLALVRF